jgi:hypothetical protein
MSVFGPQEFLLVTLPGTAKNITILFEREAGGDARAGIFGGFHHQHAA